MSSNNTVSGAAPIELAAMAAAVRAKLTAAGAPFELVEIDGMAAYRHAPADLPALINGARQHAGKEFIVFEDERWSYERFFAAVDALAGRLQQSFGLQPGQRVAIAMRNRPEWAVAFAASALCGAVPAPLNSYGLREELLSALEEVEPALLICDADRHGHVAQDLAGLSCKALVVDGAGGDADWPALLQPGGPALQPPVLKGTDPALILFTSGASSRAKGVLSTQRSVGQALFNIDYIGAISAACSPEAVAALMAKGLQPTTLTAVPLFHVSGLHAQLLSALRHGRRLVFMYRWDPARALDLIQRERITQFNGAPSMVGQLLIQPGFDDPAVTGSLGGVGFGGAGLPQRLIDQVLQRFPNSLSGIGFGMTESNGVGTAASGRLFQSCPTASGVVSPLIELRIADLDGQALPVGEAGEIWLRGITVMQAYWRQPEATAQTLQQGWLRTGDIGILDEQGFLRVVDRIKDVINRAGEKIAAAEIESCLLQHEDIAEAAVFGQADELTGERVVAVVVARPGRTLDPGAVQAHVAARLAAYKVPTRLHVRDEALPKNPAGKLLKTTLKKLYAQD